MCCGVRCAFYVLRWKSVVVSYDLIGGGRMLRWRGLGILVVGVAALAQAKVKKAPADEVRVEGTHLEQTSRCNKGGAIRVLASDSHLLIAGDCTDVIIAGERNWIQVEHAGTIRMLGGLNTVLYQDSRTQVDDRARGNSVAPKWPQ